MAVDLIYRDIPPNIQENLQTFEVTTKNNPLSSITLSRLKRYDDTMQSYATLEKDYWKLDGSFVGVRGKDVLLWSTSVSSDTGSDGQYMLSAAPVLTRTWETGVYYTSPGVYFVFSEPDYCSYLNIKWYRDNELILDKDYYPDDCRYFARAVVDLFNKVVITFYAMNKPNRFLKLIDLIDGRILDFTLEDIESMNILEEMRIVPKDDSIPINTIDVSILQNKDDIDYIFQARQNVSVYFNDDLFGVYFITDGSSRTGKYKHQIPLVDYKGLLDTATFAGGRYVNKKAGELIDEIMRGENIPYTVDSVTANQTITGILSIMTKREALSHVLTACVSVCDSSRSDTLRIFKLDKNNTAERGNDKVFIGSGDFKVDAPITAVNVTIHDFVRSEDTTNVFEGTVEAGTHVVQFSSPVDDTTGYSITGATLDAIHTNYAVITASANGKVVIKAYTYEDNTIIRTLENTVIREGTPTNEQSISNCPLISYNNANNILENMLEYYKNSSTFEAKMLIEGQTLGQYLTATTDWAGTKTGFIEKMEYTIRSKQIGTVTQHSNG